MAHPFPMPLEQASALLARLEAEFGEFVLADLVAAGFRDDVAHDRADPENPSEWLLGFEV